MAVRKTLKAAYQIEEKKPQKWGVSSADYNTQRWRDYKKRYIQYRLSLGQTTCDICKKDFGFKSRMVKGRMIKYLEREIDHVRPISMGGEMYDYDNLQQLCHVCHTRKTSKEIKERQ